METMEIDNSETYIANSIAEKNERADKKAIDKQGLPWVEKYRPSTLDELIAHDDIRNILKQLISTKKLPHLLFYGPPGRSSSLMFSSLF
jgi:replication-associated recombination protein RarA